MYDYIEDRILIFKRYNYDVHMGIIKDNIYVYNCIYRCRHIHTCCHVLGFHSSKLLARSPSYVKLNFNQNGRRGKSDNDSFRVDFCPRLSSGSVLSSYSQAGSSSQSHVYKDYPKFDRSEMRDAE